MQVKKPGASTTNQLGMFNQFLASQMLIAFSKLPSGWEKMSLSYYKMGSLQSSVGGP